MSLYQRHSAEENNTCAITSYPWANCRHLHQTTCQDKVWVLPWETWPGGECLPSWEECWWLQLRETYSRTQTEWVILWENPWVGCAHEMGVSFLFETEMERCVALWREDAHEMGVLFSLRWRWNDVYPYEGWRSPCDGFTVLLCAESWDDVILQMILLWDSVR